MLLGALLVGAAWLWSARAPTVDAPAAPTAGTAAAPPFERASTPTPIATAGYDAMLGWRSDDWQVARLAENPAILVIEFPTLAAQGQALNRLAALIEKAQAPRDRVLSDDGLARFIQRTGATAETFYFGHDYPAEAVARFFTLAVSQQVRLNPAELRLGTLLLSAGLLIEERDRLVANPRHQAIVSFSALQRDNPATAVDESVDGARREAILRHELSHGEFFTNPAYRGHSWVFWRSLDDADRAHFRRFLTELGYDPSNEELMANETQAFLMHTPDSRAFSAQLIGIDAQRLRDLAQRFARDMPASIFSTIGAAARLAPAASGSR